MRAKTRAQLAELMSELTEAKKVERVRKAISLKAEIVEEIKGLLNQYGVLAVISADATPTAESRKIFNKVSNYGVVRLYKNSLVLRALDELGAGNLDEIAKYLTGSNVFVFTNMNPFEFARLLDRLVEYRYAKPGDVVDFDVELAPGPTDIKPGPSMSLFGKLKIPTQVREGVVWIARDTKILKAGDKVSPELCSLLRRLGIPIIPVRLKLKAVYESGRVYLPENLKIDLEEFKKSFAAAASASRTLALELALPVAEVVPELILRAYRASVELAAAIGYVIPEVIQGLFVRALAQAVALAQALSGRVDLGVPVGAPRAEARETEPRKKEEEEKPEKEVGEEEIAEGIASLFG